MVVQFLPLLLVERDFDWALYELRGGRWRLILVGLRAQVP
jgi:hypothetical protein